MNCRWCGYGGHRLRRPDRRPPLHKPVAAVMWRPRWLMLSYPGMEEMMSADATTTTSIPCHGRDDNDIHPCSGCYGWIHAATAVRSRGGGGVAGRRRGGGTAAVYIEGEGDGLVRQGRLRVARPRTGSPFSRQRVWPLLSFGTWHRNTNRQLVNT